MILTFPPVGIAATLISRAKSETSVLKRKGSPIIDPETGEQSYKEVYVFLFLGSHGSVCNNLGLPFTGGVHEGYI